MTRRALLLAIVASAAMNVAQPQPLRLRDHLRFGGTQLDLRGTAVRDEDLEQLNAQDFRTVRALLLAGTGVGDAGLSHAVRLQLTQLDLARTRVTDAGLGALAGMSLARLDLTGTVITDAGLKHVARLPLRTLVLRDTRVQGPGLANLRGMELATLDLSYTAIGDSSLPLIAAAHVRTLDLSDTRVSERGLPDVARIDGLTLVDLSGTRIDSAAIARFRRSHPSLQILSGPRSR